MPTHTISERAARAALSRFRSPNSIAADLATLGAAETWAKAVRTDRSGQLRAFQPEARLAADQLHAQFLIPGDPQWPAAVDQLETNRPVGLWVRGRADLKTLTASAVGVVGNRHASAHGQEEGARMARELADAGRTLVTTTAFGIDSAVLRAGLDRRTPVVAVMPRGLDVLYPDASATLRSLAFHDGTLISLHPPGVPTARTTLAAAAVLTAALSRALVLVESRSRTTPMKAAQTARELGRPVFAMVPISDKEFRGGSSALIRSGAARSVMDAAEVLAGLDTSATES